MNVSRNDVTGDNITSKATNDNFRNNYDLIFRKKDMSAPLEKDIEKRVKDYAREKGMLAYKFTSPMRAAVPDDLLICPTGRVVFVEFKRKGKVPTPAQLREHERLRGHKVAVYVIDDIEQGKRLIDALMMPK